VRNSGGELFSREVVALAPGGMASEGFTPPPEMSGPLSGQNAIGSFPVAGRLRALEPSDLSYDKPLRASLDGFTLHAGALETAGREAFCATSFALRSPKSGWCRKGAWSPARTPSRWAEQGRRAIELDVAGTSLEKVLPDPKKDSQRPSWRVGSYYKNMDKLTWIVIAGILIVPVVVIGCGSESDDFNEPDLQSVASEARGCRSGQSCQPANACSTGVTSCTNGKQVCTATGNKAAGTACGVGLTCNGAGTCTACVAGVACQPASVCKNGAISCSTGAPVCTATGNKAAGTACGTGLICNGSGVCQ
jgi:hypothetical protein